MIRKATEADLDAVIKIYDELHDTVRKMLCWRDLKRY